MRTRIAIIIEESLLAKIDAIAREKPKRSTVISTALREFVAREESKAINVFNTETIHRKAVSGIK